MFTQEQLNTIKEAAKKSKNQGELAVYKFLHFQYFLEEDQKFTESQWNIIKYCAEECKRQRSGEMSVYDMVNAWNWMQVEVRDYMVDAGYPQTQLSTSIISNLGTLVEPSDNKKGFRTIPIGVTDGYGGWIEKMRWDRIPDALNDLFSAYYSDTLYNPDGPNAQFFSPPPNPLSQNAEDEFYFRYEEIHPFRDGNGRSGKILYNYLLGTLDNPQMPPNFWGGSNP